MKTMRFNISGMTCAHCEARVQKATAGVRGVNAARASFRTRTLDVTFDPAVTDESALVKNLSSAIEKAGYRLLGETAVRQPVAKVIPIAIVLLALYLILRYTVGFDLFGYIPAIDSTLSLSALFITGLFTSVHCVAMCGGINLSQSVGTDASSVGRLKKPLLYNLGRVISYTVIGGIVGGLGSVLFLSQTAKAVILVLAAVGMLYMGFAMLGWLPRWLVLRTPKFISARLGKAGAGKGPLVVGLLNGLMPCGPLQAMQLYALATGSALTGALSMLLFSLGTVPLMLGAGALFSALKGKFVYVVQRVSAVLVVFFAVVMAAGALNLFGVRTVSPEPAQAPAAAVGQKSDSSSLLEQALEQGYLLATVKDGAQSVEADLASTNYPFIIVQKGLPVTFTIKADAVNITGCNQTVVFPAYNVQKTLKAGDNVIQFTPEETGLVPYTCWMGMQDGRILVVDTLDGVQP